MLEISGTRSFYFGGTMEEEIEDTLNDTVYDDGVYILATRKSILSKHLEYRVAHVVSVDKLYGDLGKDKPEAVPHLIKHYFGKVPVFKTEAEATAEAMRLHEEVGGTDNGIGVIYAWEDKRFKQLIGE